MCLALLAIRVVFIGGIIQYILQLESGLHSETPRTRDQVVSMRMKKW